MANQEDPNEEHREEEAKHNDERRNSASIDVNLEFNGVLALWVHGDWVQARTALIGAI